jgi:hypothetical protein
MASNPLDQHNLYDLSDDLLDKHVTKMLRSGDREDRLDQQVVAAFKTVETFSGLVGRKLWLKNSTGGAYTDGWEIGAPFKHSYFYQMMEHELSHILFKSNLAAKDKFADEYTAQIRKAVEAHGKSLAPQDETLLRNSLGMIVNVVEDHRVNSLWAMLYPGSYAILNEYATDLLNNKASVARAHDSIINYFLMVAYDVKPPAGPLDRLGPAMTSALKKVERKGPMSTFIISKWLVTQLVSELIRSVKGEPPPQTAGSAAIQISLPAGGSSEQGDDEEGEGGSGESGDDAGDADAGYSGKGQSAATGADAGADWNPPEVTASAAERVSALQTFIALSDKGTDPKAGEEKMKAWLSDVKADRFDQKGAKVDAINMVKAALETDVTDSTQMDLNLARSEEAMSKVIDTIMERLQADRKVSQDDWISRDAHAKVTFRDVREAAAYKSPMSAQDNMTASRLKELMGRVRQRKAKTLAESGSEIDIEALIARRINNSMDPVFKVETSGRGFKTLVLLDRSASMAGEPTTQVERATRILRKALKQPNIEMNVWGFQSSGMEVILTRLAPNLDAPETKAMPVRGETPIHVAVRTAVNWLGVGSEKKQLIIITDGEPVFATSSGHSYGTKTLMQYVQKECVRARKQGINVTAIGIGNGVSADSMRLMFGERKYWTQVRHTSDLGDCMVKTLGTSFIDYIKNG